ncbi:glycosyltransferase involved in cell wall biosynthesis [Paenibacillus phyllosphaerae]|uniref:Glycosyltransferase involved in cell wall biosynthesis n=1 Tax=Paenibacillus phyllosphaerae TaxID=274593 RepID=A0A7W5FL17_9BACL|nr:glycosyltransferase family 4 protein [Paenibacillus phyllosphaerae]MBB3108569.1 glycosyltransferase involved in cell wall biosynthesis [Paenibacillus phyllosphaerae]
MESEVKQKVVIIEPAGKGGICHYTYKLAASIKAHNYNTVLITNRDYEFENDSNINFQVKNWFVNLRWNKKFKKYSRMLNGALYVLTLMRIVLYLILSQSKQVHMQWISSPTIDRVFISILKIIGIKVILTAHNVLPHEPTESDRFKYEHLYNKVDHVIVHSESNISQVKENINITNLDKFTVIPHGNYMFENMNQTEHHVIPKEVIKGKKVLLFFGVIRPYKGLDILLDALNNMKGEYEDWVLVIAGSCDNFNEYEEMINKYSLEEKVIRHIKYIPMENIAAYFSISDVVVLPYRNIYQSGVVQMAYAFGKPVICSRVGGFVDVVDEGETGLLFETGSSDELSKILLFALTKADLNQMGQNASYLARTKYSWEQISVKTIGLYEGKSMYSKAI